VYSYVDADQQEAAKKGESGFVDASKTAVTPADLKRLERISVAAKAALDRSPSEEGKKNYAEAETNLGIGIANSADPDRHKMYTTALRHFRSALKADPTNQEAKMWSDTIVSIYKSMGKPVPD
jgi:hypothetical protein